MSRDERALSAVPPWVHALLATALAMQCGLRLAHPPLAAAASDLPPAPSAAALRLASFDEPEAAARLAMLYLQAFDLGGANRLPYRELDYHRLAGWLQAILELDPRSEYPLFSAARVYAEVPDAQRSRIMLDFLYAEFLRDPNRRWPWLAHATLIAKHQLHDLPLALRYAKAIDRRVTTPTLPLWAKQMELFILEDLNELDAAKIMLGGLLASGQIHDPAEARFLQRRLEELEARSGGRPAVK